MASQASGSSTTTIVLLRWERSSGILRGFPAALRADGTLTLGEARIIPREGWEGLDSKDFTPEFNYDPEANEVQATYFAASKGKWVFIAMGPHFMDRGKLRWDVGSRAAGLGQASILVRSTAVYLAYPKLTEEGVNLKRRPNNDKEVEWKDIRLRPSLINKDAKTSGAKLYDPGNGFSYVYCITTEQGSRRIMIDTIEKEQLSQIDVGQRGESILWRRLVVGSEIVGLSDIVENGKPWSYYEISSIAPLVVPDVSSNDPLKHHARARLELFRIFYTWVNLTSNGYIDEPGNGLGQEVTRPAKAMARIDNTPTADPQGSLNVVMVQGRVWLFYAMGGSGWCVSNTPAKDGDLHSEKWDTQKLMKDFSDAGLESRYVPLVVPRDFTAWTA
ncbi:unnamed protein product [Parascedosporium putredinis]|uniref:Uncharacterized protein n=1 Tax=Parascedosporium putredinis TaxID=1442378 RepID=A0A9P1GY06_9PEZI|nr:unnamed protein product [Parascedosporium putredinis]CAI7990305.1 unnamed protein product [Parascedosporium putredinis]